MNEQIFREHVNTPDAVEKTHQVTNNMIDDPDFFADADPVAAELIEEIPMGGTIAAVPPLNAPVVDEFTIFEIPPATEPRVEMFAEVPELEKTVPYDEAVPFMGEALLPATPIVDEAVLPATRIVEDTSLHAAPIVEDASLHAAPIKEEALLPATPITQDNHLPDATISPNVALSAALLSRDESEHFRTRWNEIQGKFVDEPRSAVQLADGLVSEVIGQITQMFDKEHSTLEVQWNQGNEVSTEDLRMALQHYRSFFNRLVV